MLWSDQVHGHTKPLIVGPSQPSVVGTIWRAIEPEGNEWDRIQVKGFYQGDETAGFEVVVAPAPFGECRTADLESLSENYVPEDQSETRLADLKEKLNRLAAEA